jgi:predicted nucleotide-binding protein (sugar kinase/HSP70/actin superfamily)
MPELLDELDVIERFEQPGSQSRVGEMTKKQMNLHTLLGGGRSVIGIILREFRL